MSDTKTDEVREIILIVLAENTYQSMRLYTVDAILSALAEQGYKVLGREPTKEMVLAAHDLDEWYEMDKCWRAMFDAAPTGRKS